MRIVHFGLTRQTNKVKKRDWLNNQGAEHVKDMNSFDQMFNQDMGGPAPELENLALNKTRAGRDALKQRSMTPNTAPMTALGMDFDTGKVRPMLNRPPETRKWTKSARLTNKVYTDLPYMRQGIEAVQNLKW